MIITRSWLLLFIIIMSLNLFPGCGDKQAEQARQAAIEQANLDRVKAEVFAKYPLMPSLAAWTGLPKPIPGTSIDEDLRWLHQQMIKGQAPLNEAERDAMLECLLSLAQAESGRLASLASSQGSYFSLPDGSAAVGPEWQNWCRVCGEYAVGKSDCELLGALSQAHLRIGAALLEAAQAPGVASGDLRRLMGAASIACSFGIRFKCDAAACTGTNVNECKYQAEQFSEMLLQLRREVMAASGAP